ncbi:Monovalent cation/H+ antiporter subunit E [Striga asiatica]|uniref:Monovalent cation/H+ antiporter subunit E n=1 Tax=Striga asiatica TaxID=4170 RepID=A0A5A7QMS4_STRAF|nr:Monovalent cation/H+ antiporter subunit E [Striga asiatica]
MKKPVSDHIREKTNKAYGHNGERATTFPMMIKVGDTSSFDAISFARSSSSLDSRCWGVTRQTTPHQLQRERRVGICRMLAHEKRLCTSLSRVARQKSYTVCHPAGSPPLSLTTLAPASAKLKSSS